MCVSVYRRSEMGLSGCKVHSADAVAQDFDEGRAPSASESNLEGCLPKGIRQRHDSSRDSAGEGIKCIGAWPWLWPVVVRGVASSSSWSSVVHGQEVFAPFERVDVQCIAGDGVVVGVAGRWVGGCLPGWALPTVGVRSIGT